MRPARLLLISSTLLAAGPVSAADSGFYLGAGIGDMTTKVDNIFGSRYDFDEGDLGFKIFGGYKFFPWLSVEGAYIYPGSPEVKKSNSATAESLKIGIELNSLVGAALFTLPIGDKFELFIKPGFVYWDASTSVTYSDSVSSLKQTFDDNGGAFFLGGGAGYKINETFSLRLEYEWFEATPEYDGDQEEFVDPEYDASATFFSASFVYSF